MSNETKTEAAPTTLPAPPSTPKRERTKPLIFQAVAENGTRKGYYIGTQENIAAWLKFVDPNFTGTLDTINAVSVTAEMIREMATQIEAEKRARQRLEELKKNLSS